MGKMVGSVLVLFEERLEATGYRLEVRRKMPLVPVAFGPRL